MAKDELEIKHSSTKELIFNLERLERDDLWIIMYDELIPTEHQAKQVKKQMVVDGKGINAAFENFAKICNYEKITTTNINALSFRQVIMLFTEHLNNELLKLE